MRRRSVKNVLIFMLFFTLITVLVQFCDTGPVETRKSYMADKIEELEAKVLEYSEAVSRAKASVESADSAARLHLKRRAEMQDSLKMLSLEAHRLRLNSRAPRTTTDTVECLDSAQVVAFSMMASRVDFLIADSVLQSKRISSRDSVIFAQDGTISKMQELDSVKSLAMDQMSEDISACLSENRKLKKKKSFWQIVSAALTFGVILK